MSGDERAPQVAPADLRALLRDGEMELLGVMRDASNYTFAAKVAGAQGETLAIWKPAQGEQPLWDFPDETLWQREVAAFELSDMLGWDIVPLTLAREGPYGVGAIQHYVDHVEGEHYMTLLEQHADEFRLVAAFDVVTNNADRKSSHCLLERHARRIRVIDHGVCFHTDEKLRTVIWDFAGEALPGDLAFSLSKNIAPDRLAELLTDEEIDAMLLRAEHLVGVGRFPDPPPDRRAYPWPPV